MDSYGIWDLIQRYLLPGWWVIPIYTTITAWVATIAWWRRALRLGRDSARRLLVVLEDGPALRRYVARAALALPFFLLPVAVVVGWYLAGSGIWAAFHDDVFDLAPNPVNLGAVAYAVLGLGIVAAFRDDEEARLAAGFWYGMLFGIPLGLLGLINLAFALLNEMLALIDGRADWEEILASLRIIAAAFVPSLTFWTAGWLTRKGGDLLTGHSDLEPPDQQQENADG